MAKTTANSGKENQLTAEMQIQRMLFQIPIYQTVDLTEKRDGKDIPIRVLAAGSGFYVEKFLDLCLQAGQMDGYSLSITVMSEDPQAGYESYCTEKHWLDPGKDKDYSREDLRWFVGICVNGKDSGAAKAERYGSLDFVSSPASYDEVKESYDYIFVSLGDDRASLDVARTLADRANQPPCPICYVCESEKGGRQPEGSSLLYPVSVSQKISPENIDPQLEAMAFNANHTWNPSRNVNMVEEYKDFVKDDYNHASSMEFALSLKYKLFSVGIVVAGDRKLSKQAAVRFDVAEDWSEAADIFSDKILKKMEEGDPEAKRKFDTLAWLEHRRWVLSQIAKGWSAPREEGGEIKLEECADLESGRAKNGSSHTHACLVFSTPGNPLREFSQEDWDQADESGLDELDQMSVQLHRILKTMADAKKRNVDLFDLKPIRDQIPDENESVDRAFRQYEVCVENILQRANAKVTDAEYYDHYESRLLESVWESGDLPAAEKKNIRAQIDKIHSNISVIIECNANRDYKKNDEDLIYKIPFILTFRRVHGIVMAFDDGKRQIGRNEAIFANVASATVLCPEEICYLYCFDRDSSADRLEGKISAVLRYLSYRNMTCLVTFRITCALDADGRTRDAWSELKKKRDGKKSADLAWGLNLKFTFCEPEEGKPEGEVLLGNGKELDGFMYDGSTGLFSSAEGNGRMIDLVKNGGLSLPYFEFEWRHKKFTVHNGCDYLKYMEDDSYIRVDDMFILMGATDKRTHFPDFNKDKVKSLWENYTGSRVNIPFAESVTIWQDLCKILQYKDAEPSSEQSLEVSELDINVPSMMDYNRIFAMLKRTGSDGLIEGLQRKRSGPTQLDPESIVSFTYTSKDSMKLLTNPGEILKIYTYYKILETGYFDDVIAGFEFNWEDGGGTSEVDLVLTKGFRSVIIECEAVRELEADYPYKLFGIGEIFGIGAAKVLVGNTTFLEDKEQRGRDAKLKNARLRKMGDQMGVDIISGREDIENIGEKLKEILTEKEFA